VRALRLPAAIAVALVLQGCAGALVQDDWHAAPAHAPLQPYHIEIASSDLPRVCGKYPGMMLHGCAQRIADAGVCLIYTAPHPAAWLMEHERKHCAGWDHGPQPGATGIRTAAVSSQPG
jgi:hypothetical protein